MKPSQTVADLGDSAGRHPSPKKKCLQIRCRAVLIGSGGLLHGVSGLRNLLSQPGRGEWQAERVADGFSHSSVIEEQERVPRVEEDGAKPPLRMRRDPSQRRG